MLGLILGAPLTAAAIHIAQELGEARAAAAAEQEAATTVTDDRAPPAEAGDVSFVTG